MCTDRMLCNLITLIDCRAIRHPLVDDNSHRGVKGDGRKVPQRRRRRIVWRLLEAVLWDGGVRRIHIRREGKYLRVGRRMVDRTLSVNHGEMVEHRALCLRKLSQDWWNHREQPFLRFLFKAHSWRSALKNQPDQVGRFIMSRAVFHFNFNSSFFRIARSDGGGYESCSMFKKETPMISFWTKAFKSPQMSLLTLKFRTFFVINLFIVNRRWTGSISLIKPMLTLSLVLSSLELIIFLVKLFGDFRTFCLERNRIWASSINTVY